MALTLRRRILLTLIPLLILLIILGSAGAVLLYRLGGSIDAILRDNYESIVAMERLNEALERIDSSFQIALAGRGQQTAADYERNARAQFDANWKDYDKALAEEQRNITIHPQEDELVAQLEALTEQYRSQGQAFYRRASTDPKRHQDYFATGGLFHTFDKVKRTARDILVLNQDNMKAASREAMQTAEDSLYLFGGGLAAAAILAGLLAWGTLHTILRPIQSLTQSALAIGLGNLDQVVPVLANDELGQLADAFNTMAKQLRQYRQTGYARLLRAQRTSQATIDSFPDPVLVVDSEGRIEMANPAARRQFGVTPTAGEPGTGLPWQPPEPLLQPLDAALRQQQPYLPEGFDQVISLRRDGQECTFLPRILPIRDPYQNTLGAAVLLEDVTRFRLMDQIKSDLLATVSHELKTPLTGIRLALHLLLEETVGPLTPKQTELLMDARDNAERLVARVNSLLDLARLEQRPEQLDLRPQPIGPLLQAATDAVHARAADKGVELVVELPPDLPLVALDGQRLGHALGNLLDNAITYTDRRGRITVAATAASDTLTVSVTDTGVGIPPEYLPHVFDKFFRVPGQSTGGGSGLGLAIAQEIVHAHGGEIRCESRRGAGTVFSLTLPIWKE
jgi:PAS domain S-box-containing protein